MAIDVATQNRLRRLLSEERHTQLHLIAVVVDAATLAAEQVQDVRIANLENPESPDTNWLLDVLVSLAFDVLAPKIVQTMVKAALGRFAALMRSTGETKPMSKGRPPKRPATELRRNPVAESLEKRSSKGAAPAEKSPVEDDELKKIWKDLPDGLIRQAIETVAVDPLKKKAQKADQPTLPSTPDSLRPDDTPGVAVRKQVLAFARRQTYAVNVVVDLWELAVAADDMTAKKATEAERRLVEMSAVSLRAAEQIDLDLLSRFFEACIWATLYPEIVKDLPEQDEPGEPGQPMPDAPGGIQETVRAPAERRLMVPSALFGYLRGRLPCPFPSDGSLTFAEVYAPRRGNGLTDALRAVDQSQRLRVGNEVNPPLSFGFNALANYLSGLAEKSAKIRDELAVSAPAQWAVDVQAPSSTFAAPQLVPGVGGP